MIGPLFGDEGDKARAIAEPPRGSWRKRDDGAVEKTSYVYMLASECYGTLYVGVTSNLVKRIWQHREGLADGFTKKHKVKQLVWFEMHEAIIEAITRENQIKRWNRAWKIRLIQSLNPEWRDLFEDFTA